MTMGVIDFLLYCNDIYYARTKKKGLALASPYSMHAATCRSANRSIHKAAPMTGLSPFTIASCHSVSRCIPARQGTSPRRSSGNLSASSGEACEPEEHGVVHASRRSLSFLGLITLVASSSLPYFAVTGENPSPTILRICPSFRYCQKVQ